MICKTALVIFTLVFTAQGAPKVGESEGGDAFIIGGEIVKGREFPSQVYIMNGENHLTGSGSILNSEWILTTYTPTACGKKVTAGTNRLNKGGTVHTVVDKIIHEKSMEGHNIALLKVSPPIDLKNGVEAVKLPRKGQEVPAGSRAVSAGWGGDSISKEQTNELRKIELFIKDLIQCQEDYSEEGIIIYDTEICAHTMSTGKGLHYQDVGASLFVNDELVGLSVWTTAKADMMYPDVFINVALYIDWIEEHIKS